MTLFRYTGPSGQRVGFGIVETGQVYEVTDDAAPLLEGDADFTKLTGKAATEAESSAVTGWPEAASEPAVAPSSDEAPSAPALGELDRAIVTFTEPAPKKSRSTAKK